MSPAPKRGTLNRPRVADPEIQRFIDGVIERLQLYGGERPKQSPLDRVVTFRDFLGTDLVTGNGTTIVGTGSNEVVTTPAPTGLVATGAFQTVILEVGTTAVPGYAYTEYWRAAVDDLGQAQLVVTAVAPIAGDKNVQTNSTYYYWARFVSTSGHAGPFNATAGTVASTAQIVTGDLADLLITSNKLAAASVDTAKIANLAILAGKIADGQILNEKIADGAVGTLKLANLAVTEGKIGTAAITTAKIANAAVGSAAIANLAVGTAAIANLAVTEGKIADLAVTNAKIGLLAVDSAKIADGAIVTAKIGNLQVTTAKIADTDITTAKIADAAITNAKIGFAAVDTLELAGQAVTIPVSAYSSGEIVLTQDSWNTLQSVSITSTGAPIFISASFAIDPNASLSNGFLRLKRGSTIVWGRTGGFDDILSHSQNLDGGSKRPKAFTATDQPGAGTFTYEVQVKVFNDTDCRSASRSLAALETKR